jgi:hypothetical protein
MFQLSYFLVFFKSNHNQSFKIVRKCLENSLEFSADVTLCVSAATVILWDYCSWRQKY